MGQEEGKSEEKRRRACQQVPLLRDEQPLLGQARAAGTAIDDDAPNCPRTNRMRIQQGHMKESDRRRERESLSKRRKTSKKR